MAPSTKWYGKAFEKAFNKEIDFGTDTVKCMLLSAYTFDQDLHEYIDDVLAAGTQASGTGYTAGGVTLTSCVATYTGATNVFKLDSADPTWANATISVTHAVIYIDTGTASTSPVLFCIDLDGTKTSSNGTFKITMNASGIGTITVS